MVKDVPVYTKKLIAGRISFIIFKDVVINMEFMDKNTLEPLLRHSQVLVECANGPKVFITPNNELAKVFYGNNLSFLSRFYPFALRFKRNADKLQTLGIASPKVKKIYYYPEKKAHIVVYPYLRGLAYREIINKSHEEAREALDKLPQFLSELHDRGVYFKDMHLGNLLLQHDGNIALVGVTEIKFKKRPLSTRHRVDNLSQLLLYPQDKDSFSQFGISQFLTLYLRISSLKEIEQQKLHKIFMKKAEKS